MIEMTKQRKFTVCEEAPVDLIVNGKNLVTFMCTPQNLKELAVGYLYCRGLITTVDDVYTLAACDDMRRIYATTKGKITEEQYGLAGVLASGCGNGVVFSEEFLQLEPNPSNCQVSSTKLQDIARQMFAEATLYKETGGVHCAILSDGQEILTLREDVGRHNAVDKIMGKGLFLGVDFTQCVVLTTGRISSDMVLKAVAARVPIIGSRSIPSSLALEIAEKAGITVVGRILAKDPIIYSREFRILLD